MKHKILLFSMLGIFSIGLIGCSLKTNEQTEPTISENVETNTSIEDYTPVYNDYKTYTLQEAVKQDWFSQIGEYELKKSSDVSSDLQYCRILLGYNEVTDTSYLMPDEIVIQGKTFQEDKMERVVITKEEYMSDIETFVKSFGGKGYYTQETIDAFIEDELVFTEEEMQDNYDLMVTLDPEEAEEFKESAYNGRVDTFTKQFVDICNLGDFRGDNFVIRAYYLSRVGQKSTSICHMIMMDSSERNPDYTEVLFVYDDLGINISYSNEKNEEENIYYTGDAVFYTGIMNKEENEQALGIEINNVNDVD